MSRFTHFMVAAATIAIGPVAGIAQEADRARQLPVSTKVKVLASSNSTPAPMTDAPMMVRPPAAPVTLPSERLPQYQLGHHRSQQLTDLVNQQGDIRFVLAAAGIVGEVGRPLLVRAQVLIDGKPYAEMREQQGRALLAGSTDQAAPPIAEAAVNSISDSDAGEVDATESDADDDEQSEPVAPATEPQYVLAADPAEMLRRYAAATGETVSEGESGWLLTHWSDGPALLVLHPYYQSFRADQRPVYRILDRDRDNVVSPQELEEAVDSIRQCDFNRDDIVDVQEIAEAANRLRDFTAERPQTGPVLLLLSDLIGIDRQCVGGDAVLAAFDSDRDGIIAQADVAALEQQKPDIELLVEFASDNATDSKITLVSVSPTLQATVEASQSTVGIRVSVGTASLNFIAIQNQASDSGTGQISLGAVVDGYPLLPEMDPNDDGRFTIRELRQLTQRLGQFDTDRDGALNLAETQSPIRVSIGLGPIVHRELAAVRAVAHDEPGPTVSGPDWFVRMDRNRDHDLTRGEFPGTDDQFQTLDADSDQLISAEEALQFDQQSQSNSAE